MIQPPATSLFEPVWDRYGLRLALVFGNQAAGGLCPYYAASRCHHCDIGAGEGRAFQNEDNLGRLEWFQARYAAVLPEVAHLVLYNSGSTLNPRELAPEVLEAALGWARGLPKLTLVSLDSREAFITPEAVESACRACGRELHPILGLESADDHVRNELLAKKMSPEGIRRAFRTVGGVAVRGWRVGVDVNVVIGGPGTSFRSAVQDAVATARYALELGREAGVRVDLNLHPYYPSRRGRDRFPEHGRCPLSLVFRVLEALDALRKGEAPDTGLFLGWQDEGHDQDQDTRSLELSIAGRAFSAFNRTQDALALQVALG